MFDKLNRLQTYKGVFMKRSKARFFCVTVELALLCAVLLACGSSPAPVSALPAAPADELDAAGMDLDAAIREAAAQMAGKSSRALLFFSTFSDPNYI
jgi:hypothetical protein